MIALLWLACGPSTADEHAAVGQEALEAGDVARADRHLGEACRGGLLEACVALGAVTDAPGRVAALEAACEGGHGPSCHARRDAPGDGWSQRACSAGHGPACLEAAEAATDPIAAARFSAQACHAGALGACWPAADHAFATGAWARAAALYEATVTPLGATLAEAVRGVQRRSEACDAGDGEACWAACLDHALPGVCDRQLEALQAACARREGRACTQAALARARAGLPHAEGLWAGCDRGDPWACLLLADRLDAGVASPPGTRGDAAWLRNQACDLQLDYGCAATGL